MMGKYVFVWVGGWVGGGVCGGGGGGGGGCVGRIHSVFCVVYMIVSCVSCFIDVSIHSCWKYE